MPVPEEIVGISVRREFMLLVGSSGDRVGLHCGVNAHFVVSIFLGSSPRCV